MRIRRLLAVLGSAALVASGLILTSTPASALTFTVNTGGDAPGVCPATCTLRATITAANLNPGPDVINFSINGTITLVGGVELQVADATGGALTITGNGTANTIVNGANASRVINVTGASNALTLQNLTIENGTTAAASNGGGVQSGSTVTTGNANFSSNTATQSGGAISAPNVVVVGGTFDNNSAFAGGGIDAGDGNISGNAKFTRNNSTLNRGGAVVFSSTLTVDNSTFGGIPSTQGNTAAVAGGAIATISGTALTVTRSIFINNSSPGPGGAIYTTNSSPVVTITNSAILSNLSGNSGGGITIDALAGFSPTLNLSQSVLQDNRSTSGSGGAVELRLAAANSTITANITNNTFDVNKAVTTGAGIDVTNPNAGTANVTVRNNTFTGGTGASGSVAANGGGTLTLIANIISGNGAGTSCAGTMTNGGSNLIFNDFAGSTCPTGGTNITGQDPLLGPLQVNAPGFTATRALGTGSPAINAVSGGCPPPAIDQRGVTRAQGVACDIGAYELLVASSGGGSVATTPSGAVAVLAQPRLTG